MRNERKIIDVNCDFCKKDLARDEIKQELQIIIKGSSLDGGIAVGPAYMSGAYDLCYSCYSKILAVKNEASKQCKAQ